MSKNPQLSDSRSPLLVRHTIMHYGAMRTKIMGLVSAMLRDVLINSILASVFVHSRIRAQALRLLGHEVDATAVIAPHCFVGAWRGLVVGPGAAINRGSFFDLGAETVIGAGAGLGFDVMVMTCTHELGDPSRRWGKDRKAPVHIGSGCWIGSRSVIMPGVTIGNGCIVAAGSVVVEDCRPNALYAGVPAKWKRDLPITQDLSAGEIMD